MRVILKLWPSIESGRDQAWSRPGYGGLTTVAHRGLRWVEGRVGRVVKMYGSQSVALTHVNPDGVSGNWQYSSKARARSLRQIVSLK